jgi:hypothetical protein
MKKLMVIVLTGCLVIMSYRVQNVAARDGNGHNSDEGGAIPLSDTVGTYATTGHGSEFACFQDTPPFPLAKCGSPGTIGLTASVVIAGSATVNLKENCATFTAVLSNLPPDVSPPIVIVLHSVFKLISYDPATGTGDESLTDYNGGTCNGPTFDSTGATVADTGTVHFTVSQGGDRIDSVVTSLNTPVGSVGDFSISSTALRH